MTWLVLLLLGLAFICILEELFARHPAAVERTVRFVFRENGR